VSIETIRVAAEAANGWACELYDRRGETEREIKIWAAATAVACACAIPNPEVGYFYECYAWDAAWYTQRALAQRRWREVAALLRHIVGNPYQPVSVPSQCSQGVESLAAAAYSGQPCSFALHDALLEAANDDLAQHFRDPAERHPKGCWALDLILGKT